MLPHHARLIAIVVTALASLGCSRNFSTAPGTTELGRACDNDLACVSGVCADGVCCDQGCGGTRACNLPGKVGTCSDRSPGTPCSSSAQCPTGFCRDGVCCLTACSDNCMSCNVGNDAGTCLPAPDNTDPHRDCGFCAACFAGNCGPAFANTDPHHDCVDAGTTCYGNFSLSAGDDACGIEDTYACSDDSCAGNNSYCIAWSCMESAYFHVDDYPFLRTDLHRTPLAMAVGPGGDTAVLVNTDDGLEVDGGYLGSVVAAVAPSSSGPWTAASVEFNAEGRRLGAVAFTGDIAHFAVGSAIVPGSDVAELYGYSGIYVQAISSLGEAQGFDTPDPNAVNTTQIALDADAQGRLTLASITDAGELRVTKLGSNGLWGGVLTYELGASGVALAPVGGETQLFYVASGELVLSLQDGGGEVAPGLPGDCTGPLHASTAPDPDGGDAVGLTLSCDGGWPYLVAFAPARADSPRWLVEPAPAESPLYGLEDDGVTTGPLSQFLPSGGRAGTPIFTALDPGDLPGSPRGGYTQTMWMSPDGGFAYTYYSPADNGYRYQSMAACGSNTGAPLSAFDSVVDIDGGTTTNNSTLLIQVYFP
ncbi:MAG: hypothetical protein JST54_21980 [Deltaproteobacteria bacterium]|nr:hypothetical protein [Deltaproteobacteria bacterium]